MRLDFEAIKKIPIVEVCARGALRLKYRGEYAYGKCPLPTHPADDKNNTAFQVHIPTNRWTCKHMGCGARNGVGDKWGDVINFVQVRDRLRGQKEAAQVLADMYNIKSGPQNGSRPQQSPQTHKDLKDFSSSASDSKRTGHIHDVNVWFDQVVVRKDGETDEAFWARIKEGFIGVVRKSYRNGLKKAAGLGPEPLF